MGDESERSAGTLGDTDGADALVDFRWLADAPLFIDEDQIGRFYDAVVRPPYEQGPYKVTVTKEKAEEIRRTYNLSGSLTQSLLGEINPFFAGLKPKVGASFQKQRAESTSEQDAEELTLNPIDTPQRQLEQLTLHYLLQQQEQRLFLVSDPSQKGWRESETISKVPRELVFLDLPGHAEARERGLPETKIIPMAAEFADGRVVLLYDMLIKGMGEEPPRYPDLPLKGDAVEDVAEKRREHWSWFDDNFKTRRAIEVVEEAASEHGRIRWIAYRLPIANNGDTLHLDVVPDERYHTGTLAYNLIRRGYKHGLRLVGTLKSEPDMNVLAVYEK